jgi:hypothetical protein
MSDTILSGDFTVYYLAENRQKRIVWTGSATGTRTVNELYSALADLLDELNQMDDGSVMSAQTPTEYTIGIIDPSDKDPWFIDRTSVEHLKGGALKTNGWARVTTTNTGIVRIPYLVGAGANFITSDIGKTVTNAGNSATGTLLDFATSGGASYAWIRPTSSASGHDWGVSGVNGAVTVTSGTGNVTQSATSVSGEMLWANIYNTGIATLASNTTLYVYQNSTKLTSYKGTFSWWPTGTFDVLIPVKDMGTLIDGGYVTVFARQADTTYAHFITALSSGGRNPIPLQTALDLNNSNIGYRTFTSTSGTGTFVVGEIIFAPAAGGLTAATKKAVLTAVSGSPGTTPTLTYYLIGDLTDFVNTDTVKGNTSSATCTSAAPSNTSIVSYTSTITHGNTTADINEDGTSEYYSIAIDLTNTYSVLQGYQWTQFLTRRGGLTTTNTNGIEGEQYIGSDYRISYTTLTGSIAEGTIVTGVTSGATGTVVSHNTTAKILVLRNSRGTFSSGEIVRRAASNEVSAAVPTQITPISGAPFGLFAGGTWFTAPGVVLVNFLTADVNKFQLIDDTGATVVAPTKVNISVDNTRVGDRVAVFRLTAAGGIINKTEYVGTTQSAGATTLVTGSSITNDTPGKSTGGIVRIIKTSTQAEYRLRYNSYAGSTFTLSSRTGLTADSGSTSTVLFDAAATFVTWGIKVGDLIRNTTESVVAYVTAVTDETHLTTTAVTDWTGDSYEINTLPVAMTSSDNIYVPIIDSYETTGSSGSPGNESTNATYISNVAVLVRARQAGQILPFETESTITSGGMTVSVIRTSDTIFT